MPEFGTEPKVNREMAERFRSGDALFVSASDMSIVVWNAAAEQLTGVPAAEALGKPCWDVMRGVDEAGALVCHPGCSGARLAREGWPVPCRRFLVKTTYGHKLVSASTVTVEPDGAEPLVVHVLQDSDAPTSGPASAKSSLTRRQHEVLELLAQGFPAKLIAQQLDIADATARNHIQAILGELRCHSQLEAVAEARRRGLV